MTHRSASGYPRHPRDFYRSPPEAIDMLFAHVPAPPPDTAFLDVGFGDGRLAYPLIRRGYTVHQLDVVDHDPDGNPFLIEMDFLDLTTLPKGTTRIVSNPPYSKTLCRPLIEHAVALLPTGGVLHLLLPSLWFGGKTRQSLWQHASHQTMLGRCSMLTPDATDLGKRGKVDFSWFTLAKTPRTDDLVSVRHLGSAMA